MATFRVGQRVRIIVSYKWPHLSGSEGTVIEECRLIRRESGTPAASGEVEWMGVRVLPDIDMKLNFVPCPHQLEPISDSNTKISWADMADLWTPKQLEAV